MKLLELYTSVQGEGPNTGKPTQFIRFAGCNMRCPGWPCDTPQAIFPDQWQDNYGEFTPQELLSKLPSYPRHLCLTGGEPFIQKHLAEFAWQATTQCGYTIDIFTNGSLPFPTSLIHSAGRVTFIMDWKLVGSGEHDTRRRERIDNATLLTPRHAVKFVVKSHDDLVEARWIYDKLRTLGCQAEFWVGAAWDHIEDAEIVKYVTDLKLPWRLNIQLHKHIWDPEARYT